VELYFYSPVRPLGVERDNFTFTFTFFPLLLSLPYSVSIPFQFFSLLLSLCVSLSSLLSTIPIFLRFIYLSFVQFSLFLSSAIVYVKMGPRNGGSKFASYPIRSIMG